MVLNGEKMNTYFVVLKAIAPGLMPKKVPVKGTHGPYQAIRYVRLEGGEKSYMGQISKIPLLSPKEEHELTTRYFNYKDQDAYKKLIESNLRLVAKMAHQGSKRSGVKFDDLVQEGNLALMDALERFDPRKGAKFSTFAFYRIRHYLRHYIGKFWQRTNPLIAESEKEENVEPSLLEKLPGKLPLPGVEMEQRELEDQVAQAMKKLNEREAHIIRARILTDEPKTLEAVGVELGLSKMRIKQIQTEALGKLKIVMGKSFLVLINYMEDFQKAFRLARFKGGEAEKKTTRKEREESGIWSQKDLRMKRMAKRRKEEVAPPSW
jgi:RNA polymerase sigma factor (sigma-70 family)